MSKKTIRFEGLVYEPSGYGTVAREMFHGLSPFFHSSLIGYAGRFETGESILSAEMAQNFRLIKNAKFDKYNFRLSVMAAYEYLKDMPDCDYQILATVHEADYVKQDWVDICNRFNEIWVPSNFVRGVFDKCGVKNTVLFPHGVSQVMFENFEDKILPQDLYTFLSIFEPQFRKAPDVLLRAYLKEFTSDDKVSLVLKTNPKTRDFLVSFVQKISKEIDNDFLPKITILAKFYSDSGMSQLYDSASAYVFPSRAEGFSLTCLEAMAHGKPVIATDYSAMKDYLTDKTGYPLKVNRLVEIGENANGIPWYEPNMKFAEPDEDHLRGLMRMLYETNIRYNIAAVEKAEEYRWSRIVEKMRERLYGLN